MKNNTKSVKSPAPAKKITVKKIVRAAKVAVAPKPAGKVAPKGSKPPVKKAPAKRAPAPKVEPVAPTAVLTTITAYHPFGAGDLANKIAWRVNQDGTAETYAYTAPATTGMVSVIAKAGGVEVEQWIMLAG